MKILKKTVVRYFHDDNITLCMYASCLLKCFDEEVIEEDNEYIIKRCTEGWIRKYYKQRDLVEEIKPVVENW